MLQLQHFYEECFQNHLNENAQIPSVESLFLEIKKQRLLKSRSSLLHYLDQKIWTDKIENIDRPDFEITLKKEIIEGLHLKNKVFGTYKKAIDLLRPAILKINREENRPARILELGSGMGKLTHALYEEFTHSDLQVELTGSDIVPEYIEAAERSACEKNYSLHFKVIDAFHLEKESVNSYDIIFTLHSMHHFTPSELATIMAGAKKIQAKYFIGIDGYRGFGNLLFMMLSGGGKSLLSWNSVFFQDSLTSGRKMYTAKQLEILGKLSCPHSRISARNCKPGLTIVEIQNFEC